MPTHSEALIARTVSAPGAETKKEKYTSASRKASSKLTCRTCNTNTMRREERRGFWQKVIACRFGYFPWECGICRKVQLFRDRGTRQKSNEKD